MAAIEELTDSGSFTREGWEVFLSFRGSDTRRSFISHLASCLKGRGINVFIDYDLRRGNPISKQLMGIIRSSRVSVVVFSRNYGQSRWCLQELCEIMECSKMLPGRVVLPVFYNVTPNDVRRQGGQFGEEFYKYKDDRNFARWKDALTEAADLSGWDVSDPANGPEAEILRKIADRICKELDNTGYRDVGKYPVGLEHRINQVKKYLNVGHDDVHSVAICGMRGIGKTTLATAVYNQLQHTFEGKSLLANVGEKSKERNGLVKLQRQLLKDILLYEKIDVEDTARGISMIRKRLEGKRVLVILDDVTHPEQLNALLRDKEWLGKGSIIIITATNPDLVSEIVGKNVYEMKELDPKEAVQLFSMHAFRSCEPKEGFTALSEAVVDYCDGLPLALEVLGSTLHNQGMKEWQDSLDNLKRNSNRDIQKRLELCYHVLDRDEKRMFLDIACFFVHRDKDYVLQILNGCGFSGQIGMRSLVHRNLVKIRGKILDMHGLIQDMGKEIVREESIDPGERSRLFFHEDILQVLQNPGLGTRNVEGLALSASESTDEKKLMEKVDAEAFSEMKRLRLLCLQNVQVDGDYGHISKELRWLCWHGFPLKFLPDNLNMGKLVAMDMQYSKLRVMWRTSKTLGNLKVLDVSHSHFLSRTPEFSILPNLEELIMEDCNELKTVDGSIGHLQRLVSVNLKDCKKLQDIPDSICYVKSLQVLSITGCSKITSLPDDIGLLESLVELLADGAPIAKLPLSLGNLKNLKKLYLHGYDRWKSRSISELVWSWISKEETPRQNNQQIIPFSNFKALTDLRLKGCNLSDGGSLQGIGALSSLQNLVVTESLLSCLPDSISSLSNLRWVQMHSCPTLESLPPMPYCLKLMSCKDCPSLTDISYTKEWYPGITLTFEGCSNLSAKSITSIIKVTSLALFPFSLSLSLSENESMDLCSVCSLQFWPFAESLGQFLYIPWSNIPEYFEHQSRGTSLTFQVSPCGIEKIVVSFVLSSTKRQPAVPSWLPSVILYSITSGQQLEADSFSEESIRTEDQLGVLYFKPSLMMDIQQSAAITTQVTLQVEPVADWVIKGVGVHLEEKKRPRCRIIDLDEPEPDSERAGPSHGGSSEEYLPEDELTMEISGGDHQWTLLLLE
ncbi:hypothetical protein SAY87_003944 [Trapa incisa]|uniref:TIR domain-containing protein n=1 Tax=Trapa incisa TaxID=236973 RepID=A0AAN7JN58_9MYRT|nr:hypothetical protein SAY87_003944 [Trapa incisa]